jgi:predicted nucleotidyltransferase
MLPAMQVRPDLQASVASALRRAGASFAFVHGSRAAGRARADSDVDVAAWWGGDPPSAWEIELPEGVDLLILDRAPLELAGRVALHGVLLFDDDPPARVRWQAETRRIYLDEEERQRRLDALYLRRRHG